MTSPTSTKRNIRCKFCKEVHATPKAGGVYELHCPNCGTITKVRSRSAGNSGGNSARSRETHRSRSRRSRSTPLPVPGPLLATLVAFIVALVVTIMVRPPMFLTAVFGQFVVYVLAALFISCLAAITMGLVMAVLKRHHRVAPLRAYPWLVIILSLLVLLTTFLNNEKGNSLLAVIPLPERHQGKLNEFLAEAHGLASQSLDNSSTGKWQTVDETPKSGGDLGKIERLMKQWSNQLAAIKNEHLATMDAIHYDTLLSPGRLVNDAGFLGSRRMIGQVRSSLDKQQQQLLELADSASMDIDQLEMSAERKLAAKMAYQEGVGKGLKALSMLAEADSEIIDEQEHIIRLLDARKRFWRVANGRISFKSKEDTLTYQTHLRRIEQLEQQQESTIQQTVEQALRDMERYRK